jgi:hypothetical protein
MLTAKFKLVVETFGSRAAQKHQLLHSASPDFPRRALFRAETTTLPLLQGPLIKIATGSCWVKGLQH